MIPIPATAEAVTPDWMTAALRHEGVIARRIFALAMEVDAAARPPLTTAPAAR